MHFSLAAVLALAAFSLLALPALPKADSGAPTIAKKKKQKKITGKLSKGGYTVLAVAKGGDAKTERAPKGKFKLRPPAKKVALHLRAPDGTYAGPIVVGKKKKGKLAILGVKAGAKLGKVKIKRAKGYAKVKQLRKKWVVRNREARAKKGVPIGAGNFGLVRSKKTKGGGPGDLDLDGITDRLDIDANGNLVLDRYEPGDTGPAPFRSSGPIAHASAVGTAYMRVLAVNEDGSVLAQNDCNPEQGPLTGTFPEGSPTPIVGKVYELTFDFTDGQLTVLSVTGPIAGGCPTSAFLPNPSSALILTLKDTVNANAAGLTVPKINEVLARRGFLVLGIGSPQDVTVELDCGGSPDPGTPTGWSGGLSYCTKGGTGRFNPDQTPGTPPRSWPFAFPDCCDPDGDGFGEPIGGVAGGLFSHGATTDQIGTGDVLNWRITRDGAETQYPTTLPDALATVPALVSYEDGAGNSGTLSYPVPSPFVGTPPDWLGEDPGGYPGFEVAPCPAGAPAPCVEGDVVVTFTFWRPQREAIPGVEQGQWTDIGGLNYGVTFASPTVLRRCLQSQVSTTDPSLTPEPGEGGFRDSAADRPADPANTLSFSVNMTECHNFGWPSGEAVEIWLDGAINPGLSGFGAVAGQQLYFTRK